MKIGIFYYTSSGNTEEMAKALASGCEAGGASTVLMPVEEAGAADLEGCDRFCLGSPAQGSEEMDETAFMPFFEDNKNVLMNAPLFLFGSYGWGGGQYMEDFAESLRGEGATVIDVYTHLEAPDNDTLAELEQKGKDLVG